jgi:hypothetical protein
MHDAYNLIMRTFYTHTHTHTHTYTHTHTSVYTYMVLFEGLSNTFFSSDKFEHIQPHELLANSKNKMK